MGKQWLVMAGMAMVLTACATSEAGRRYDATAVSALRTGQTTEADAERIFGQPLRVKSASDGSKKLLYAHTTVHANGFTGKGSSDTEQLILQFGPDGKLTSYDTLATPPQR